MKKFLHTISFLAVIAFATACADKYTDKEFTVKLDHTEIAVQGNKPGTVSFTAQNYNSTVTVKLNPTIEGISINSTFDSKTGTGNIEISTTINEKVTKDAFLEFSDGQKTVQEKIKINISDYWTIEPEEPENQ